MLGERLSDDSLTTMMVNLIEKDQDLVYDKKNSDEFMAKIDVEWIASDFVDQQKKKMKAMLDFAAANCDVAA